MRRGPHCRLGAVLHPQLPQNGLHVHLNGGLSDYELAGGTDLSLGSLPTPIGLRPTPRYRSTEEVPNENAPGTIPDNSLFHRFEGGNSNGGDAVCDHAEALCCCLRQINNSVANKRSAVVDTHFYASPVTEIFNDQL
jgi:hypothetical protein